LPSVSPLGPGSSSGSTAPGTASARHARVAALRIFVTTETCEFFECPGYRIRSASTGGTPACSAKTVPLRYFLVSHLATAQSAGRQWLASLRPALLQTVSPGHARVLTFLSSLRQCWYRACMYSCMNVEQQHGKLSLCSPCQGTPHQEHCRDSAPSQRQNVVLCGSRIRIGETLISRGSAC
jgi:hypothetical protein